MQFDHVARLRQSDTVVRGQVLTDHGEGEGSVPATVDLLRRYQGSPTWAHDPDRATTTNADRTAVHLRRSGPTPTRSTG